MTDSKRFTLFDWTCGLSRKSLAGYNLYGHTGLDTTEVTWGAESSQEKPPAIKGHLHLYVNCNYPLLPLCHFVFSTFNFHCKCDSLGRISPFYQVEVGAQSKRLFLGSLSSPPTHSLTPPLVCWPQPAETSLHHCGQEKVGTNRVGGIRMLSQGMCLHALLWDGIFQVLSRLW